MSLIMLLNGDGFHSQTWLLAVFVAPFMADFGLGVINLKKAFFLALIRV